MAERLQPGFIDGPAGRLFLLHHRPQGEDNKSGAHGEAGDVIYLPPFAEEMNRALADAGRGLLTLDLFGCGDSDGDFSEATWAIWRDDVAAAGAWLASRGSARPTLLGLRDGGLLALDVAARHPADFERVVLWQPVVSGRAMVTRFLRLKVAAAMGKAGAERQTAGGLRARLAEDASLEIAGYRLSARLAGEIEALELPALGARCPLPIHWFEVAAEAGGDLAPASARVVKAWRAAGLSVTAETVAGEAFWALQEITLAPGLVARTCRLLENP